MKCCACCGTLKPLSEFTTRGYYSDGQPMPYSYCSTCRSIKAAQYRVDNIHRLRDMGKKCRDKLKLRIMKYYSQGKLRCACCGERHYELLTLDHIHDNGAEHRRRLGTRSNSKVYHDIEEKGYPADYQVLCMNCNFAKEHFDVCPHQRIHHDPKPWLALLDEVERLTH